MARAYTVEAAHPGNAERPGRGSGRVGGARPDGGRQQGFLGRHRPGMWRRGRVLSVLAVLLGLIMALHSRVPNTVGGVGSLLQTFLPWVGLGIPLLFGCALLRRSATALVALLLPTLVWANLFGGLLTDKTGATGAEDLVVVTHNVNADNPDPVDTARRLAASGAHLIALEELTKSATPTYAKTLRKTYPHQAVRGTVAIFSRYPLSDTQPVDMSLGWTRALRTTVHVPGGRVAAYVAHLPSVRVRLDAGFAAEQRDVAAEQLGRSLKAERLRRVILLGDLNGTMNDGALAPVTSQLRSTQGAAGAGFGFSWPAAFPMARIDQILVRGVEPVSSWSLPATASDHLPLAASVKL